MLRILTGMALGAAGAFMLDPRQGRRRRALLRDGVARNIRESRAFREAAVKDLRARARGAAARLSALRGGPVSDEILVERVRARLGRYVSHPHAVRVAADAGIVTLTGEVLAGEHPSLVRAMLGVPGLKDLEDRLDVHTSAEAAPSLQSGGERAERLQRAWSPGTRALAGGTGAALVAYALARGGLRGVLAIAGGAALLARARVNRPLKEVMRRLATRASSEEKTLEIAG